MPKVSIAGAGLAGLTAAVLFKDAGWDVVVHETTDYIGGSCYEETDSRTGLIIHALGPHIFHTDSQDAYDFISRFTRVIPYNHSVLARTDKCDALLPIPYNMVTEKILGHKATDEEIRELFFIDYSEKMWGMPFAELPDRITSRVPKRRANADCGYFDSRQYQGLPSGGYNAMFTAMAAYATEDVRLLAADDDFIKEKADLYVCTGPIDAFFDYAFGALPYRTLDFVKVWTDENLPVAVVNECNKRPYTRTTDYSWFSLITDSTTVMNNHSTVWVREYPRAYEPGETKSFPFYPMPFTEAVQNRYNRYLELSKSANMLFCGRLGTYTYMDMDKTILDVMRTVSSTLR